MDNFLSELPFYSLDLKEFLKATGAWIHHSSASLLDSKDLFQDIIESPDRESEIQDYENNIESKYYTIKQTGNIFAKTRRKNGFSMMHYNMRSLSKNISLLQDILSITKEVPDIIAISETKLNENSRLNISIPGYEFLNTNSETSAGGVGLYLSNELEFVRRKDFELSTVDAESCWIEIMRKKG